MSPIAKISPGISLLSFETSTIWRGRFVVKKLKVSNGNTLLKTKWQLLFIRGKRIPGIVKNIFGLRRLMVEERDGKRHLFPLTFQKDRLFSTVSIRLFDLHRLASQWIDGTQFRIIFEHFDMAKFSPARFVPTEGRTYAKRSSFGELSRTLTSHFRSLKFFGLSMFLLFDSVVEIIRMDKVGGAESTKPIQRTQQIATGATEDLAGEYYFSVGCRLCDPQSSETFFPLTLKTILKETSEVEEREREEFSLTRWSITRSVKRSGEVRFHASRASSISCSCWRLSNSLW